MLALATLSSLLLAASSVTAAPTRRDAQTVLSAPPSSTLDTQAIHLAVESGCAKGFTAGSVSHSITIPTTLIDVGASLFPTN